MKLGFSRNRMALAIAAALGATAGTAIADKGRDHDDHDRDRDRTIGTYVAGDFHNHTTCSDGTISMQKLVKKATDTVETPWGLDWFVQAGHGGNGNRNCTLPEDATLATPAYPLSFSTTGALLGPNTTWQNNNPPIQPKGLVNGTPPAQNMWRWQALQEFQYPLIEYLRAFLDKPLFLGNESVVAGHEHSSMSVITGQIPREVDFQRLPNNPPYNPLGNATALSMFNYCFDAGDPDTSRGNVTVGSTVGNNWDCSNPTSPNSTSVALGFNDAAKKIIPVAPVGTTGHAKTVEGMKWMATFHPDTSYYVPAHLERAGPFNPNGNNGYNVESLRDFNNAAPRIAVGFETQPGHGASDTRGEYIPRRNNIGGVNTDSVGGTTYGGTGVYGAQIGGVWDALLGEGRNWWFFASSDWHTRGAFGPDDRRTVADFYPGEYQRTYVMVRHGERHGHHHGAKLLRPQSIVDGLRTGNAFASSGQLIDRLAFIACEDRSESSAESAAVDAAQDNTAPEKERCATMGEKLVVSPGSDISVAIVVRDPEGPNFSPYSFNNPSLAQVGIQQPINRPVLDHIDVIRGMVSGYKTPGTPDYSGEWPRNWLNLPDGTTLTLAAVPNAAKNTSAAVIKTFNDRTWSTLHHDREFKVMTFKISKVKASQYVRLRGSNMPANVPFETDANGNPLPDIFTNAASINKTTAGAGVEFPTGNFLKIACNATGSNVPANGASFTVDNGLIDGCPNHLFTNAAGQKLVSFDVAAWSDLWFYSNPIFIEVKGSTKVVGVK